ncbi:MAG: glycosyltransferase family protein [Rhodothermales bacterium]
MARILYALNGQGRGHTSRALGVAHTLRQRGHDVLFCCGADAADRLRRQGEFVLDVPAPAELVRGNRVRLLATAWQNAPLAVRTPEIVEALTERIDDLDPDLVVADFEPFAPRAARRLGLPVVALSHQQILTETRCHVPLRYAASAALTRLGIGVMAPRGLFDRVVVPSFFFPPHRAGSDAALVPPILRPDVLDAAPRRGAHLLVYVNHPEGSDRLLDVLRRVDAPFVVYNVPAPADSAAYPNLTFRAASRRGFVDDLAACRAVVSTAGFTLLSEALHLGKPVLAAPNRGFFEQAVNALYLRRSGRGDAVLGRLTAPAIERFLRVLPPVAGGGPLGNALAADHIEAVCPRRTFALAS